MQIEAASVIDRVGNHEHKASSAGWTSLAALGVVFGDLGTSPLYTLQTVVQASGGRFTPLSALGILSSIIWTLIITISIKYCAVRDARRQSRRGRHPGADVADRRERLQAGLSDADRHGSARRRADLRRRRHHAGHFGAERARRRQCRDGLVQALRHADGRGHPDRRCSRRSDSAPRKSAAPSGRSCCVWFVVIAALGIAAIAHHPGVLAAIDPRYAVEFLRHSGEQRVLGARRRVPLHHRRRGPVRRHGSLRPEFRSAGPGMPWCCRHCF